MKAKNPLPLTPKPVSAVKHSSSINLDPSPNLTQIAVAVIGSGYWGKNLVRNFYELGVLKTICDSSSDCLDQMGKTYPGLSLEKDFNNVLKDNGIQAVVIASPAVLHYQQAKQALEAGKHVFVEKPLSLRYQEGEELVALAEAQKRTLFVGHILHYHPAMVRLKELVNEGRIGRLQYIYSRRLSLGKIRREENILWSFAPHDISVILGLTGEEPSYVDSMGSNFLHARIADVTMTNLKFPSGIGAHIFVSWLNPFKEQRLVVVGSQGMFVFDDTQPIERKLILYPHLINWKDGVPIPQTADELPIDISERWEEPLKAECRAYLSAIGDGHKPITSGEEGLRVLKILELSQHSIEEKEIRVSQGASLANKEKEDHLHLFPSVPKEEKDFFVHESAIIDDNVFIGSNTKIWHFSHILSNSKIGENCNIGQNVVVGPDAVIGNKCKMQNNVSIYKGVTLEDGVFCGPSMVFTNINNPRAEIGKMDQVRPTVVKKGATLGANCTIVCGHTIGRYAFIGAGAVVTKDVPDHALVVGNPARQIGWTCKCGGKLKKNLICSECGKKYKNSENGLKGKS